jgi:hypothetical protein
VWGLAVRAAAAALHQLQQWGWQAGATATLAVEAWWDQTRALLLLLVVVVVAVTLSATAAAARPQQQQRVLQAGAAVGKLEQMARVVVWRLEILWFPAAGA